jgi:diaminopimelate decarboxylase
MSREVRVQGLTLPQIAEQFGTPLYVYDSEVMIASYRELRDSLPPAVDIFFSLKANPNLTVCALFGSLGAGAEVSSLAELTTALRAGVKPADIIFVGPGKTDEELRACLRTRVHAVVCESAAELQRLEELSRREVEAGHLTEGDRQHAMLRINPDFSVTGAGLSMGGKPRQFGIDLAAAASLRPALSRLRYVQVTGIHAYLGTRFLDAADIVRNTARILAMAQDLARRLAIPLSTVDVGGGLGVAYFDGEKDLDLSALAAGLREVIPAEAMPAAKAGHPGRRLIMETGRFLTAAAGTYVMRVLDVKESMGETFVITDGGTNHHMAAVGVGSFVKRNFPVVALNGGAEDGQAPPYTVCGPLCTPDDVIARRVCLPRVSVGDLIGLQRSGAYGPTASPGLFLSHGYPAEVMVHQGRAHLIRVRDEVDDLLSRQRPLAFS